MNVLLKKMNQNDRQVETIQTRGELLMAWEGARHLCVQFRLVSLFDLFRDSSMGVGSCSLLKPVTALPPIAAGKR